MEKTLDRESQQKLYVQLIDILRERIQQGEWPANTIFPTERELCSLFDVSKATVRVAISELVREGLLKRQQGRGTFVTEQADKSGLLMKTIINDDILCSGAVGHKQTIIADKVTPPEDIRGILMTDGEVFHSMANITIDDSISYVEELFTLIEILSDLKVEDIAKMTALELIRLKSKKKIHRIYQNIHTKEHHNNQSIPINEGAIILIVERSLYCSDNTPIAHIRYIGRNDKFRFCSMYEKIK